MDLQLSFKKPSLLELEGISTWSEKNLQSALDDQRVIGAYYNDLFVGYLIFSKPDWCIEDLVISESFRRKGFAKALIAELVKQITSGESIYLEVRSKNLAALSLYQSENFKRIGIRQAYYSDDDAIIMRRIV